MSLAVTCQIVSNVVGAPLCMSMPSSRLELSSRHEKKKTTTSTETAATGGDTKNHKKNKKDFIFSFFLGDKECTRKCDILRNGKDDRNFAITQKDVVYSVYARIRKKYARNGMVRVGCTSAHVGKFTVTKLFATFHSSCDFLAVGWNVGLPLMSNIFQNVRP